jgi:nucleotide-binding universal stress UspA family protein
MTMFKKIVWATDGSEAADHALPIAQALATDSGGQLSVVHITEFAFPGKAGGSYPLHADEEELTAKITEQVATLVGAGIKTSLETGTSHSGGSAHAIAVAAEQVGADVVVVGTRGHTMLAGILLGSVTQRLLHIAPCPVLAVPPPKH